MRLGYAATVKLLRRLIFYGTFNSVTLVKSDNFDLGTELLFS